MNNFLTSIFLFFRNQVAFITILLFGISIIGQNKIDASTYSIKAESLKTTKPDSAIYYFNKSYDAYLQNRDTVNAIKRLLDKAYVYENNAKYAYSYNALWQSLLLLDNIDNESLESVIYHRLGRIYSYYKREDKAIEYLKKALAIQKNSVEPDSSDVSNLVPYYYSIASTYRELSKPNLTKSYLDSCYLFFDKKNKIIQKSYLDFEKAYYLSTQNKNNSALELMFNIQPWFQKNTPSYMVLFYKYLGDIYLNKRNLTKSENLYLQSLDVSKKYNSHLDFTPLVYEKLAEVKYLKKDFKNAFKYINIAKQLNEQFFDSRSLRSQNLLEIKDDYRLEKERQERIIKEQYLKQLEQEDQIIRLQRIILIISLVFLLIVGLGFFNHLRTKHKAEKELIRKRKELEIKKTQELLELKNRELAASALQLIEKDEFLKDLKTKVREGGDKLKVHELNKVLRSVSVNNNKNWDEFRMRFIEVNKDFYNQIFEKHPNLSQGDQKICALIKLNFSSKEMARLLGISVESVHTVRHRIRKKMKLPRSVNLEDYINSL